MDQYPYVNFVRGGAYNNYINNNNDNNDNNNIYARYHQQLDEFIERRKPVLEQQQQLAKRLLTPAATPVTNQQRNQAPGGVRRALANVANSRPGSKNSQILEDFLKRKAEYERNRARGAQQQRVVSAGVAKPPTPVINARRNNNNNKHDEKWAYEQRLERVRQQNYANRRLLAQRNPPPDFLPNYRLQKAAALKVSYYFVYLFIVFRLT